MVSPRITIAFVALLIVVSACSGPEDGTSPVGTRALLPPAETIPAAVDTTTTTSQAALSPVEADQLARTEVRAVLAAAEQIYAETGSYDADPEAISALTLDVDVVSLEQVALHDAVAYEAFDQRLSLHRQSGTGRWFCIDVTEQGTDHGAGNTFEEALEDCTDGVRATGWGDVSSSTGPDQAAITALLTTTFEILQTGEAAALYEVFDGHRTCDLAELETVWPSGLLLAGPEELAMEFITVSGETAAAAVSFGTLSDPGWPLVKRGTDWLNAADPCELLQPLATERMDTSARETLEAGLFAVRSLYVQRTSFAFGPDALADIDADLVLVEPAEVSFGTIAYRGAPTEGLLITAAGPEVFYCAVESSYAITVHGSGSTVDEINTVGRCRANATS